MEVSGQLHALDALSPGIEPLVLTDRRLGGLHSWSGCSGEEKNSQPLVIQPVAQLYICLL